MRYDLGYFDDKTCRLEPIDNPFQPKAGQPCVRNRPRKNLIGMRPNAIAVSSCTGRALPLGRDDALVIVEEGEVSPAITAQARLAMVKVWT